MTLDATLSGATRAYPMIGRAAIGMNAVGHFKRSDFGLKQWLDPEFIGNDISFESNADFKQAVAQRGSSWARWPPIAARSARRLIAQVDTSAAAIDKRLMAQLCGGAYRGAFQ